MTTMTAAEAQKAINAHLDREGGPDAREPRDYTPTGNRRENADGSWAWEFTTKEHDPNDPTVLTLWITFAQDDADGWVIR